MERIGIEESVETKTLTKKLNIEGKLITAPMAEVTDSPFRIISKKFGAAMTFTQMVSAEGILKNNFNSLRFLTFAREERPVAVQILGNDPGIFRETVKEIVKFKPAMIDLNAGCPVTKVTSKKMGSALMSERSLFGEIVKAMSDSAGDIPISVKLRLGPNKNVINVIENAKVAVDNGAGVVSIHARTQDEEYEIEPHWEWIAKAKKEIDAQIVGNGSIFNYKDAKRMISETGCDFVMVGRGALGNPFLFSRFNKLMDSGVETEEPSIAIVKETLLEHLKLIFREYGAILGLDKAKKNIIWYFKRFDGIDFLIVNLIPLKEENDIFSLVEIHAEKLFDGFYKKSDKTLIDKKFKERIVFWLLN
ncbi:MAG: tRNA dihydrouridine synthase DusB [Chlorobi bacterium]|nr:tRNA dihydrouridine synthase DusB [Chlorobiota bacterium]